jgi:ABC-type transport system involved in multi-copper enzyme maturation permease subunit
MNELGKLIFYSIVLLELLLVAILSPALTAGAISSERERGTFDLLRTTLLSSSALVFGKLGAAIAYILLLIFAALPLQSLAFLLGGVELAEFMVSIIMLVDSTLLFCAVGIYFSSIAKRTVVATVMSYASLILPVIFVTFLFYLLINGDIDPSSKSIEYQRALIVIIWMILSSNPFTAATLSQIMLEEEQSLFFFHFPDFSVTLFSPWILYTVFSLTLTLLIIWLIVFYLNRYER